MKKRAFTLIELLAVIVILAVIAIISTPIVLNVVENAQKKADFNSAYGLIDAGRLYYSESMLDEKKADKIKSWSNLWNEVFVQGDKPKEGELYINKTGEIALSVVYRNQCYQKTFTTSLEQKKENECGLGYVGPDDLAPEVTFTPLETPFNEYGWAKNDFYVRIDLTDTESGPDSYTWCQTTDDVCIPEKQQLGETGTVLVLTESNKNRICVIGKDKNGNESVVNCSFFYALDKTAPEIVGLTDITINIKDPLNLESDVVAQDTLSGIVKPFAYSPKEVERNQTRTTDIVYTVQDQAGNETSLIRKVITVADAPSLIYTTPTNPLNEWNWAKNDFYVHLKAIDYSGHGIEKISWCSTVNASCNPKEGGTILNDAGDVAITVESDQNRVCAIVIDEDHKESTIICSDPYKLDKTNPTFSGIEDLTVSKDAIVNLETGVIATDGMSGIMGTFTYDPTHIDTSISGTTPILYTVTDWAGNQGTATRKVIVTSEAPTVIFSAETDKINSNGWAKEDFLVTFTPIDQSGHGIKEYRWCSTTLDSCDPTGHIPQTTSKGATTISVESASNRVCVIATDNSGKVSSNICSDTYKLDKTAPIAGTFKIIGTSGTNGWYRSNLTLSANDGSDTLSGHMTTDITQTSLTADTNGTAVTITTIDLAGNIATRLQTFKIDKTLPTTPIINGGNTSSTWKLTLPINITTLASDTNGIAYYEYYITTSTSLPNTSTAGIRLTEANKVTINQNYNGAYIYIRAVDNAGNPGNWSASQRVYVDMNAPTIVANKAGDSANIGEDTPILNSFFTYTANGNAPISSTTCYNVTAGNTIISNSNTLAQGTYEIKCIVIKQTGKQSEATLSLSIGMAPFVYTNWYSYQTDKLVAYYYSKGIWQSRMVYNESYGFDNIYPVSSTVVYGTGNRTGNRRYRFINNSWVMDSISIPNNAILSGADENTYYVMSASNTVVRYQYINNSWTTDSIALTNSGLMSAGDANTFYIHRKNGDTYYVDRYYYQNSKWTSGTVATGTGSSMNVTGINDHCFYRNVSDGWMERFRYIGGKWVSDWISVSDSDSETTTQSAFGGTTEDSYFYFTAHHAYPDYNVFSYRYNNGTVTRDLVTSDKGYMAYMDSVHGRNQ